MKLGRLLTRVVARTDSPRNVKTAVNVNKPRAVKVTKK